MNALRHLRRTARRHAHLADVAIAVGVLAATAATTFVGHPAPAGGDSAVALVSAVVACGVLAARRSVPLITLAVSTVAAEVFLHETGGTRGELVLLAPCIALYTVADQAERRRGLLVGGLALVAIAGLHMLTHPGLAVLGPENLAFTALGALAIAAGDSTRNRRAYLAEIEARARRAEADREQDALRRVAEERLRIARDLHDAVGHQLALISVQSNVAGQAVDRDPTAAREAISHVKAASRRALGELRDTVSLLRRPGDPVAPTSIPAPGLDGLDELLASLRASGLDIDHRQTGDASPLAPAADLTAYRVIQESLTNVYKHSRLRRARLTLCYDPRQLHITVDDLAGGDPITRGGTAGPVPVPADRHGIVGMRERVLALGGQFTAGPLPDGAFQVTATLPCQPLDVAPERAP